MGTTKSGVFFRTLKIRDLGIEFKDLMDAYARKQSGLVKEVVEIACAYLLLVLSLYGIMTHGEASYTPVLESLDAIIAHLDVILRLASLQRAHE
jgi:DNA mismatch repair protein MSH2